MGLQHSSVLLTVWGAVSFVWYLSWAARPQPFLYSNSPDPTETVWLNNLQILPPPWTDWSHTSPDQKQSPFAGPWAGTNIASVAPSRCSLAHPQRKLQRYRPYPTASAQARGCPTISTLHIHSLKAHTLRTELHAQLWIGMTWGRTVSANSPSFNLYFKLPE